MAADITRKMEIVFNATNRTGQVIESVGRDLSKLNYSVGSMAAPFAAATKGIVALDAALVAMAGAGIAYSVSQFASFDDVMRKVGGIMGASEAEFVQLTELTKNLGATTRYTAAEAAQGLEFLAMAGFNFEESMEALPQTLKLAQASATDLGVTADIVTNIMAGYGVEVGELAQTSDVLTATFTNSNTNLQELGQAFKYVGPVAKAMGLEIEDTSAVLGKLADAGYKADQGGTALRNILLALAAPMGNTGKLMKELGVDTEELGVDLSGSANALQSLGVTVKDAQGNLRPFEQIMDDLKAGLDKIPGPADRAAILVEIFGKRGGPQMAALLSQGSESVLNLEKKIRSLGGVTDKIATDMEADIGGAMRGLRSAFESVAIEVGGKFSDGLLDPIRSVSDVFRTLTFTVKDGAFDPVFNAFDRFGDNIADALQGIAENLPEALEGIEWGGLIDSFENIQETIGGIFGDIDFDDADSIRGAIQDIIDTFQSLVDFSDGIAGVFVKVAGEVKGLIDRFNDLDPATKESMGSISGIGSVISGLTGPVGQITGAIKGMGTAMQVIAGTQVVKLAQSLIGTGGLTKALSVVQAHPLIAAGAMGLGIGTAMRNAIPAIDDAAQSVLGFIDKHTGLFGVYEKQQQVKEQWAEIRQNTGLAQDSIEEVASRSQQDFLEIVNAMDPAMDSTKLLTEELRKLGVLVEEPKNIEVTADTSEATRAFQEVQVWREKSNSWETIRIPMEVTGADAAKEKIEEIPAEKRLKIETDLEIAKVKANAATIQEALQWQAKVDIAEIEAAAKVTTELSKNITEMFVDSGKLMSDLYSQWDENTSLSEKWSIQESLSKEQETREKTLKMQEKLNDAQVEYMKERTKAIKSGQALIQVDGAGLQPELEMVMWKLFDAIQIRASQEGLNQLHIGL